MPTWLKVLLVSLVLLLILLAGAVGGGLYLWRQYGRGMVESGVRSASEGREFGAKTSDRICVEEAVARHKNSRGFGERVRVNIFLRGCLEASAQTVGFCEAVPGATEFSESLNWQLRQCHEHGLTTETQCQQLFSQVQQFCAARRREHGSEPE
jgi:hypothetical protein